MIYWRLFLFKWDSNSELLDKSLKVLLQLGYTLNGYWYLVVMRGYLKNLRIFGNNTTVTHKSKILKIGVPQKCSFNTLCLSLAGMKIHRLFYERWISNRSVRSKGVVQQGGTKTSVTSETDIFSWWTLSHFKMDDLDLIKCCINNSVEQIFQTLFLLCDATTPTLYLSDLSVKR